MLLPLSSAWIDPSWVFPRPRQTADLAVQGKPTPSKQKESKWNSSKTNKQRMPLGSCRWFDPNHTLIHSFPMSPGLRSLTFLKSTIDRCICSPIALAREALQTLKVSERVTSPSCSAILLSRRLLDPGNWVAPIFTEQKVDHVS